MEGAARDFSRALANELLDALEHLLCRPPRKRKQQYRTGRDTTLDKPRDAINERARLARPGAGDDQQWTIAMSHGGELRGVQDLGVLDPEVFYGRCFRPNFDYFGFHMPNACLSEAYHEKRYGSPRGPASPRSTISPIAPER
jgi:hypothetical protein